MGYGGYSGGGTSLPIEDDPAAIRARIWLATDRSFKNAQERIIKVKTDRAVKVEEEDKSDDFSQEEPSVHIGPVASITFDKDKWTEKLRTYSLRFKEHPFVYESGVSIAAQCSTRYMVSTEGTKIQTGTTAVRLAVYCQTKAEDGMVLQRYDSFDARTWDRMPSDEEVEATIDRLIGELKGLREAPLAEPYSGPAILLNRASAVFFHEIFGHRIEGHRQKSEDEGQTFTKKVGEEVLPTFISVYDDPTQAEFNGKDLNGHYDFDDEGIPAQRVTVVEKGILRNFVMSRSPVENFPRSNGHGRRAPGRAAVSRQGNLTVVSEKTLPFEDLKAMLLEEVQKQGKPYGLIFEDITGGFTFTGRYMPQAFKVIPLVVRKVHPDGRPDELVRGVDIVGTPLTSFSKILATGDDPDIFNGACGAESGSVPVSAISPSILVSEIEIEKKEKGQEKPPILPPPGHDPGPQEEPEEESGEKPAEESQE
jgi:predicted Zn-dependent protease